MTNSRDDEQGIASINATADNKNDYENVFYKVPSELGLARHGIPTGFELIVKAPNVVTREALKLSVAKWKLAEACKKYGANVVLDFKEETFIRNSIGFSFYMHRVSGVPGIIAERSEDGSETKADLEQQLQLDAVADDEKRAKSGEMGQKLIKVFGIMMFIVFCIGFIIAK